MIRKFVLVLATAGIILSILAYFLQNIFATVIDIVAFILAVYYSEERKNQTKFMSQKITHIDSMVEKLDASTNTIKSEFTRAPLVLLNKFQTGDINLTHADKLRIELERKQKEINGRNKKIATDVVIGGLALLTAYFLLKKKI